jgi:hypothetical protein
MTRAAGVNLLALSFATVSVAAQAADEIKSGKWEFTTQMQLPGAVQSAPAGQAAGGNAPMTRTACINAAKSDPGRGAMQGRPGGPPWEQLQRCRLRTATHQSPAQALTFRRRPHSHCCLKRSRPRQWQCARLARTPKRDRKDAKERPNKGRGQGWGAWRFAHWPRFGEIAAGCCRIGA